MPATTPLTERMLTELDVARLMRFAEREAPPALSDCLDFAQVVESQGVPADVVTMNSRLEIREGDETRTLVLSYPAEAAPQAGRISVLSPVGASLLGLRCGETASWRTPQGELRTATVTAILYQPEAAGHYTL